MMVTMIAITPSENAASRSTPFPIAMPMSVVQPATDPGCRPYSLPDGFFVKAVHVPMLGDPAVNAPWTVKQSCPVVVSNASAPAGMSFEIWEGSATSTNR
jgi:hypothetical protein